ncbi:MAG: hypothetical protein ACTTIO_05005 [Candidatus Fimenecus sp.]
MYYTNPAFIISAVLSIAAIVISIISMFLNAFLMNREYEYKLSPEIQTEISTKTTENRVMIDKITLKIPQKNNIQAAYLISPDMTMTKLVLNNDETEITDIKTDSIEKGVYDLNENGVHYQYGFILLKKLNETYDLHIFYLKACGNKTFSAAVSDIETLALAKSKDKGDNFIYNEYLKINEFITKFKEKS